MSKAKKYLVTGGSGFLGSALVRALVLSGNRVRVLDNNSRGNARRLSDVMNDIDFQEADIRDPVAVQNACKGVDVVCHLAFVNGTEFFYRYPGKVLEVGVKGIVNVLDGCAQENVGELILASSSEVYQQPANVPTGERVPLVIPDVFNPRYSYSGGKIISELLALHCGADVLDRVVIFRPHNVFGPNMGWEHVIPQFILRMKTLSEAMKTGDTIDFPIQGSGRETRAFVFIDDFCAGLMALIEKGENMGIYNIGTNDEVAISRLARMIAQQFDREIRIKPGELAVGGTTRRCPDISRLKDLGFSPAVPLSEGLAVTTAWYEANATLKPNAS